MNKFQNTVKQLALKREEEEYNEFVKEYGNFSDFVEWVETPTEDGYGVKVESIHKDEEGYKRWSENLDSLRKFKEIKREVAAELRKGPRL